MMITELLKAYIKQSGISHYAIAKATDIRPSTLSRFMRGKTDMTLRTVEKLVKFFKIEIILRPKKAKKAGKI
jgi:transcriptional regulator with XRE-family HTH domain